MEDGHRKQLLKLRVELVKNLQHIEEITDILMANGILSESQTQRILSSPVTSDRVRSLLDELIRCGPNAYSCFVSSLKSTYQSFIFDLMNQIKPIVVKTEEDASDKQSTPTSIFRPDETVRVIDNQFPIIPPYPVSSSPRGYILLVNVENFSQCTNLPPRHGSMNDLHTLKKLFEDFGYCIEVLLDPDSETLNSLLCKFIHRPEHSVVDAGGLIIMSHGISDRIYAADGFPVRVDDIISRFTNKAAPGLAGKPKFILIQACRGEEKDRGMFLPDTPGTNVPLMFTDSPMVNKKVSWESLPHMSDCVIAYSTLPGFVAWRHEETGSRFVQTLASVFREYASRLHILDLLAEVNRVLVEEGKNWEFKQITQPVNTLVRPFFLSTTHLKR